jgi:signal transduction histidine kinase
VLLVEDDDSFVSSVRSVLEAGGYEVEPAASLPEALAKIAAVEFDVAVVHGRAPPARASKGRSDQLPPEERPVRASNGSTASTIDAMGAVRNDVPIRPLDLRELKASIGPPRTSRAGVDDRGALKAQLDRLTAERDELRRLAEERGARLEQIDQTSAEFLATASHDLKGPLAAIKGHSQLLLRYIRASPPRLEKLAHGLSIIDAQTTAMARLLDDLLDASRIQAGALVPRTAPCELGASLITVLRRLSPEERERVDVALPGAPLAGSWEQKRIEQVLANLIGNALKYSPATTHVSVVVQRHPGEIEVAVTDQGMGIPAEELPRLFDRFHRTPQAQASGLPGTGLGLYICQGIIDIHEGRIWSESAGIGRGATFRFTLPIGPRESGQLRDRRASSGDSGA